MTHFQALQAERDEQGAFHQRMVSRELDSLPAGEVLVRVRYSSLNYKDALSATGNPGVTRNYPHTPGIDAAGEVEACASGDFAAGDPVIVTGYDLGMNTSGGFSQYIRVPAGWLVPLPAGLSLREAMLLGTAGLTAGLCVDKLLGAGVTPEAGPVLVTGATGGVGSIAVILLAKLGFEVEAVTGKAEQGDWLRQIGASVVLGRETVQEGTGKALLKERWAGAVDTVGGDVLFNVVKSLRRGGSVACCGLTAGTAFQASVFPFILRGVNLLGVDSVEIPLADKADIWRKLAGPWKLEGLESLCHEVGLAELPPEIARILESRQVGRALVRVD
ncbi:MAG TPA: YhdH/YhfP family quinone oxidoreductase [Pseudomonas sp.]|nr:YhdH/YhfP family quinone oxidoreductase [Pseudomonas sp.]